MENFVFYAVDEAQAVIQSGQIKTSMVQDLSWCHGMKHVS